MTTSKIRVIPVLPAKQGCWFLAAYSYFS